jgi:hypothetical protein
MAQAAPRSFWPSVCTVARRRYFISEQAPRLSGIPDDPEILGLAHPLWNFPIVVCVLCAEAEHGR